MTEAHVHIELVLLIIGGSLCSAFLIAKLVLQPTRIFGKHGEE